MKTDYEHSNYDWTVSCDHTGTYRLTESVDNNPPHTLITSPDRENFYDMLDKRRDRYAAEGLMVTFRDQTPGHVTSAVLNKKTNKINKLHP